MILNERREAVEAFPHIGGARREPHSRTGRDRDHRPEQVLQASELARTLAEEREARLAVLLEQAVAALRTARQEIAEAEARAEAAEQDLDTVRRILRRVLNSAASGNAA